MQSRKAEDIPMIYDSRNDEVCSYSFIQNGLRTVTRENSKSNSNVVLNGMSLIRAKFECVSQKSL